VVKPKVLLVNDHPASLMALESVLVRKHVETDYEVITAQSGEEALRQVLQQHFAVILLDVSMPGMDGFETAQIIHSHPRSASVPIIFVTAHYADEMHRLKGYQKGAVDYLFTPIIPQILQNKVAVFVDLAKKNLQLQRQAVELAELNRNLQVQRVKDLQEANAALQAEIVERRQAEERAHGLATRDPLTGLYNRRSLMERLEQAITRANRASGSLALLFLDMDRFKTVNDTLGHDVGDALLIEVANRITGAVRESDVVARLGGDEFVVLVSEIAAEERVAQIARELIAAISAPYPDLEGHEVMTTTSIGIALYPRDGQSVDQLLTSADAAMYTAKKAGSGAYRFYDASLNASAARGLELLARFRQAIRNDEFCLHYQPKVEMHDFDIVGMEALIRWEHPEHGLIFPNDFIALAEDHDLIIPLGHWVIKAVCRQLADWKKRGLQVVPVAINVSVKQLQDELLLETILDALKKYKLPPFLLEIEVTESCFIDDIDSAKAVLEKLRAEGLRISLDDYGTGYAGLSHIKTLPVYALKIDRSFIRDIRNDNSDAMIVASTVSLARNLGLKVIAEGVESKEQLMHLKVIGCNEVQGFYLQRPVSAEQIEPVLQKGRFDPL
jgi:diguanylate cyclase (GGDEF)-like protein